MIEPRQLRLRRDLSYTVRREEYKGRTHVVVPVVALVETVVFASNAATPELVTAEEFGKLPESWNGRPVYSGHPANGRGTYVSGNSPEILAEKCIGIVFNAKASNGKLVVEAWLDEERTRELEPQLLERIDSGDESIEVSVGVFVATRKESGVYDEKQYEGVWEDIMPDHLAILPVGEIGACSVDAGCGVRAAKAKGAVMEAPKETLFSRAARLLREFRDAISPAQMSDNDLRRSLYENLRAKIGGNFGYVEAVYDDRVVYCNFSEDYTKQEYYSRGYTVSESGAVTLAEEAEEVEQVVTYPAKPQEEARAATEPAQARAACACQEHQPVPPTVAEENEMKNLSEALKTKLEGATVDQIAAIEAVFAPAAEATPAAAAPTAATVAPTLEALVGLASADVKTQFEALRAAAETKRTATITALKASGRCDITDEKFAGMSQSELDSLVKLAGLAQAPAAQATDFSGQAPRAAEANVAETEAPAPPNMAERLRAARGK